VDLLKKRGPGGGAFAGERDMSCAKGHVVQQNAGTAPLEKKNKFDTKTINASF